ncbi:hypothetical protein DMC25_27060 [Caulobacter sp. D4A]|uniref:hypothetical protein n=1 Tax=Caulobacter sp. D4A TaxID=2204171 RepID=UPI000D726DE8|nr:hypothetical protein [Caulobacter sp. D4A]PXA70412.1 hypothetical protein DMC25_27060 [Caulobacter sp. D4A]PXA96815.1 hypothetical protein DMC18_00705 [Caulobacter sp. D5]
MNWKRGLRRVAVVLTVMYAGAAPWFIWRQWEEGWLFRPIHVAYAVGLWVVAYLAACLVLWVAYSVGRWLVRGFLD